MLVHDFPTDAEGKAIPYGVYDMARNEAWVSVGRDHDTPAFAVASIRHWWQQMGCDAYPDATALFITADAGGSNGYRLRAWKHELQQLADETRLTIHVSHFPPGTSKWNKIEHRLFCHITANWRGTPLTTYETIVDRIGNTRTETGLWVRAELNAGQYPTGVRVTKEEMDAIALVRDGFSWGMELQTATPMKLASLYRSLSLGKVDPIGEFAPVTDQKHAFPHLRHAVQRGIQQRVSADVALGCEDVAGLRGDILAAVVQDVWDVLHQHSKRPAGVDVVQPLQKQPCARVM